MKKRRVLQRRSSTEGFTLLELLVVIIIIGVLFAIAAPGWLAFINNQRVGTVSGQVFEILRTAQAQAKQTKLNRAVVLDNNSNQPRIAIAPAVNDLTCPTTNLNWQALGQGEIQKGVIKLTLPTSSSCIIFDSYGNIPEGIAAATPYSIAIEAVNSPGGRSCVVVDTVLGAMRRAAKGETDCN
jgi:prepilin-type N-terminal cleavage/methylation domain-containing protein